MNEHERIAALRALFSASVREGQARHANGVTALSQVALGIGDDAALLQVARPGRLVVTVDEQVEDTHFRLGWLDLEDLGYRATMAAASDVAAMGGRCESLFAALVLPRSITDEDLLAIARGQRDAADALGAVVAGGNLARGPALSIATTAIGAVEGEGVPRSGARPGDDLVVAGPLGRAAAGLALLATLEEVIALEEGAVGEAARVCLEAWRRPLARQTCGLAAARAGATALIDISDGLAADAGHMARASGVRLVLEERTLLADATLATIAARMKRSALTLALAGGEDYALLAAVPRGTAVPGFVRVGRCESGGPGVAIERVDGRLERAPAGFDHFT